MAGSTAIPSFRYKDAQAAMAWLETVLGFVRLQVFEKPDGTVEHAELTFGETGMIMLGSASNVSPYPQFLGTPELAGGKVTSPAYLIVPDCDPLWAAAQAAGAEVVLPLKTMDYGGKAFTVRDPEGYIWAVGEYDPWQSKG
jgi:uncharacterized glyoxalase superfamily protein PhnB